MPAIAWQTIEAAIHAWVVAASGLSADNVIWAHEKGTRPEPPYISMTVAELGKVGTDWRVKDDAPVPIAGAEVRVRTRGHRTARLELQYFAVDGSGNGALQALADVIGSLDLPPHPYDLDVAGVGIGGTDDVQLVSGQRGGFLEPRAISAVMLHLGSQLESRETYVARMQVTTTAKDENGDAIDSVETWIPEAPAP